MAVLAAGTHLRTNRSQPLLSKLIDIAERPDQSLSIREDAIYALLRALGTAPFAMPSAKLDITSNAEIFRETLRLSRERLSTEEARRA